MRRAWFWCTSEQFGAPVMTPVGTLDFSVLIASQGRPEFLLRCLQSLRQQDYPSFEVALVVDKASLSVLGQDHPMLDGIKLLCFEQSNLSVARNLGVAMCGGEVIAFLDDDAVAEPTWLAALAAALHHTNADAAVGYVRGRNGISFQSQAASVDAEGETHFLPFIGERAGIPELEEERAVKLVGTNFCIKRDVLVRLGGFDPLIRYYLEDSDVSLRLKQAGYKAAVAPLAQVHHAIAPSNRRYPSRMPKSLYEIGRSLVIYARKHNAPDLKDLHQRLKRVQKARLVRHMIVGTCEPGEIAPLLATLDAGWLDGSVADLKPHRLHGDAAEFRPIPTQKPGHSVIAGRYRTRKQDLADAGLRVAAGERASVMSFSRTSFYHKVWFTDDGVWLQTGGVFGRSDRTDSLLRWCSFSERVRVESRRIANVRGLAESYD